MKRAILMLMVLAAVVAGAAHRVDATPAGPTLTVENPRIDLGEIKAGSEAVATFVLHNNGPDDVTIIRAKPS